MTEDDRSHQDHPPDEQLVERAKRGERAALDQLLARHYDRLFAVCRRLAGNDADAADACQEALLSIVRGLGRFDGRASFRTWSYRVATNACLDELRRRGRRPQPILDATEHADGTAWGESADETGRVADRMELDAALQLLPVEFRAPVVLRDVVGMDYAEIGDVLNLPPGTVRSRIARGRRHLANLVGSEAGNVSEQGNQRGSGERPS